MKLKTLNAHAKNRIKRLRESIVSTQEEVKIFKTHKEKFKAFPECRLMLHRRNLYGIDWTFAIESDLGTRYNVPIPFAEARKMVEIFPPVEGVMYLWRDACISWRAEDPTEDYTGSLTDTAPFKLSTESYPGTQMTWTPKRGGSSAKGMTNLKWVSQLDADTAVLLEVPISQKFITYAANQCRVEYSHSRHLTGCSGPTRIGGSAHNRCPTVHHYFNPAVEIFSMLSELEEGS